MFNPGKNSRKFGILELLDIFSTNNQVVDIVVKNFFKNMDKKLNFMLKQSNY